MRGALGTVSALLTRGRVAAESLDWAALRYRHTAAIRATLAERYGPAQVNKVLAALRGVLREAWRLGLTDSETYHQATDLPGVQGRTRPRGRALTLGELRALFAVCAEDKTPARARDAALIAALYGGGLRRSEVVALDLSDYNPETEAFTVRSGKGRKARLGYAANGAKDALEGWLRVRGTEPGPLFWPINKGGRPRPRRMTSQSVWVALAKRARQANVNSFSPHDLRRSFISDLLDAGADIATVQQLAGHANVTTTARYDRRGEATKRNAAKLLHVPYLA